MQTYNPKRKKIKGWKRRVRQVERWGERIKVPYIKYLLTPQGRHTYERCYLSPFYRLDKRQPPLWFYKHIIAKFVAAYEAWEHTFEQLGMPYDLQLWLYDPAYIRSEIICYKMQQGELKRFSWESEIDKPFPYTKFASPPYDLTQFEWILADDEDVFFNDDFEEVDFTAEDLLAEGYVRKQQSDGVIYYAKRAGDIWIGRRKGKFSTATSSIIQGYFAPPV